MGTALFVYRERRRGVGSSKTRERDNPWRRRKGRGWIEGGLFLFRDESPMKVPGKRIGARDDRPPSVHVGSR